MSDKKQVIFKTMLISYRHLEHSNAPVPGNAVVAPNLSFASGSGRPDILSISILFVKQSQRFENIFNVAVDV